MDRSDACIARTRFFPTNVVTFRCGQYALFKVRCVHFFRRPPSKSALHQGCSHVVSLLHVENDAVPCAQLPCVICLLSMRCSTKVDRKPFGRHVPNPDAPQRPECSAQYEGRHVRFHNLCRIGNTPAQASHQSVRQPAAHTHTHHFGRRQQCRSAPGTFFKTIWGDPRFERCSSLLEMNCGCGAERKLDICFLCWLCRKQMPTLHFHVVYFFFRWFCSEVCPLHPAVIMIAGTKLSPLRDAPHSGAESFVPATLFHQCNSFCFKNRQSASKQWCQPQKAQVTPQCGMQLSCFH